MSVLLRAFLVALICVPVFIPLAHADTVAPSPVDDVEAAGLQQLEAQTCQEVKDIQGGGETPWWKIVGGVLLFILLIPVIVVFSVAIMMP